MALKRYEKIALITAGPCVAAAGLFLGWSANYAGASFFVLKSTAMWKAFFGGDFLMPAKQFAAFAGDARISRIGTIAAGLTFAQAGALGLGGFLLAKRPWAVKPPADGSRFATLADLKKAGLLDGIPGKSILLGTFGKGKNAPEVRYSGDSHFFVNGPSRSGKGRGFVMTNLLEYQGSTIVLDVKLENWEKTGPARLAMGQKCFVFAPGSKFTHRWNPLDFVRSWPERSTDLLNLAASLIPLDTKETSIWKETARSLCAGVLGYVLESETMENRRNLRSVLRLFSTGVSFSSVIALILRTEPDLNQFIIDSFKQHLGRDEEQRPSFEGNVVTALAPFNNLLMAEATSASDFDIRELRRNPFSLFIASPVSDFGTVEPLLRLLIQQIHDVMLRNLPGEDEPHKILMMLDEFYQFERLPEIIKRAPLVAGYGMTIALIAQNIPQIDERYGPKTRDALLGNMDIKLNIAVGDDTTAKIISINLGRQYVEREGWGKSGGLLMSKQASQGRFELIPLMDPDAVLRLDDNFTILQIRGTFGAVLNKLNFYTDAKFVERRKQVASYAARMPKPELVISAEWPLFMERPPQAVEQGPDSHQQVALQHPALFKLSDVAETNERSMDDEAGTIIDLARSVYRNVDRFTQAYRYAVSARDSDAAAYLLQNLRLSPDYYGPLLGEDGSFNMRGKQARKRAIAAIAPLRAAVIEVRRDVTEGRSRMYAQTQQPQITQADAVSAEVVTQATGEDLTTDAGVVADFSAAATPASTAQPSAASVSIIAVEAGTDTGAEAGDPNDPFSEHPLIEDQLVVEIPTLSATSAIIPTDDDEGEDDTRIDYGFINATDHVATLTTIAQEAIGSGRVADIAKLSGALSRMNASLSVVMSDEPWTMASIQMNKPQHGNSEGRRGG
ncbi:type IV secretory system conjugative DNA transfer family protein [Phyllobacterium sp. TAF24]|uniref:type IV secretory system conjugative DNA transfer family protein n=1 Tax=Phyllobacterium sp. TAF24 TaxID=3233068 RepID=UPI003F9C1E8C